MKPEVCSGRLNLVVCILTYRHGSNGNKEFLMVRRDDGKFALIGGMGACCLSETMYEFAKREFDFDMGTDILIENFKYVESVLALDGKTLTMLFCYRHGNDDGQKLDGVWFPVITIHELAKNNQIAFDGDKHIASFVKRLTMFGAVLQE